MGQSLSLCLIMRDEASNIERCLKSVKDVVDEIIVVDTGSEDNSIVLAKSLGAKVFQYTWENDFSKAKNYAISKASGDWLLLLDADDELIDRDMVRPLMQEQDYDGFLFLTVSFLGKYPGEAMVQNPQVRLIQNREDIRYKRAIHEVILVEPNRKVALVPICVYHYGYLNQKDNIKRKITRNKEILLESKDPLDYFYLGSEYLRESNYHKALEYFSLAELVNAPELAKKKAFALIQLEEYAEALGTLQEAIREFPDYTDLWFLKGSISQATGEYGKALKAYTHCLSLGEAPPFYPTDLGVGSYQAYLYLGITHEALLNFREAKEAYLKALSIYPQYKSAKQFLLRLFANYPLLSEPLPDISVSLALEARAYDLALEISKDPLSKGLAYLGKREYHKALKELEKVDTPLSTYHQLLIHWLTGEMDKAKPLLDSLTTPLHEVLLGNLNELPDYEFLLEFMEKAIEVGGLQIVKKVYSTLKNHYLDLEDSLREIANRYGENLFLSRPEDFFIKGAHLINQGQIYPGLANLYTSYHKGFKTPGLYHFLASGLVAHLNLDFPRVVVDS